MIRTIDPQWICISIIAICVAAVLIIAWPYPDFIASAIGLVAGILLGGLTGGRSA